MNTVEAVFQIPDWIANGLDNGNYERVGGIIREVDSKSVVAWLRETDFSQVSPGQVISSASRLLKFGDVVGVLNLGVSATGFTIILNRIKHLEASVSEQNALMTQIDRKLDLSYYRNFATGIRLANDAMMTQNLDTKRITAMQAVDRILDAQHYFEQECTAQLANSSEIADKLISTLFLAYTAEIRCRMELGEMALAASKLEQYSGTMRTLVYAYLEKNYASFDTNYLWCVQNFRIGRNELVVAADWCANIIARIQKLESQLCKDTKRHQIIMKPSESEIYKKQQDELEKAENKLMDGREKLAQAQAQSGFYALAKVTYWNSEVASSKGTVTNAKIRIRQFELDKHHYYAKALPEALTRAESVIEDMGRFEVYRDEVAALQQSGISLSEWQQIQPKDTPEAQTANMFLVIPARS